MHDATRPRGRTRAERRHQRARVIAARIRIAAANYSRPAEQLDQARGWAPWYLEAPGSWAKLNRNVCSHCSCDEPLPPRWRWDGRVDGDGDGDLVKAPTGG